MKLQKHTEAVTLIHITLESCLDTILKNGIKASEYGDLEVNGNDGFGVYAVRNIEQHDSLIYELSLLDEPLYAVYFETPSEWYECIAEEIDDEDDEPISHIGYIVLPYNVPATFIRKTQKIC